MKTDCEGVGYSDCGRCGMSSGCPSGIERGGRAMGRSTIVSCSDW